ncbi:MAG: ribosome biogenesis GTP-binding protein YihA/YsxC [Bacteroidota bacterium]|nr:ribosome biogenesis GTP-binding protein YihA/YsxC [Bacteroidota bacterium]MDP4275433.1 ribosome biogenesis GTP-binding protein YihA/YsxC [Bacteroidota bacterium]
MVISSAKFICSNTEWGKCPQSGLPEYAFIGRSNVGKSSLINMLTRQNGLAKISSTPGKTLTINHFLINENWYLVDLPGYGYAKVSWKIRETLQKSIESYILNRQEMLCLFVLIDTRHEPQENDLDFIQWLGENGIPFVLVFTKVDKVSENEKQKHINEYKAELQKTWENLPIIFLTSSAKKIGRDDILDFIENTNKNVQN